MSQIVYTVLTVSQHGQTVDARAETVRDARMVEQHPGRKLRIVSWLNLPMDQHQLGRPVATVNARQRVHLAPSLFGIASDACNLLSSIS